MPTWVSQDRTNGGRQMPPVKDFCARCRRYRFVSDLDKETREDSPIKGKLVCSESSQTGVGCLDGGKPSDNYPKPAKPDNYYRKPNV